MSRLSHTPTFTLLSVTRETSVTSARVRPRGVGTVCRLVMTSVITGDALIIVWCIAYRINDKRRVSSYMYIKSSAPENRAC